MVEPGLHPATAMRPAVDLVEAGRDAAGPTGGSVEVHPRRCRFDFGAEVTLDADPALGPVAPGARAPGRQRQRLEVAGEGAHVEDRLAHHPGLGVGESAVGGVVGREVLQEAGGRVEAQPASRAHVGEAHLAGALEHPPGAGPLRQLRQLRHRPGTYRPGIFGNAVDSSGDAWSDAWAGSPTRSRPARRSPRR